MPVTNTYKQMFFLQSHWCNRNNERKIAIQIQMEANFSPDCVEVKKRIFIFMDFSRSWCFKAHAFELSTRKTIGCDNEKIRAYAKFFFRFDSFFLVNECSSLKIFLFLLIFRLSFFSLLLPSSSYTAASLRFLLIHSRKALSSFLIRMSENSSFCSALPLLLLLLFHTKNFIFFSFRILA